MEREGNRHRQEAEKHETEQKGSRGEKGVWKEGHRETRTGFKVARRNEQLEDESAQGGVCVFS